MGIQDSANRIKNNVAAAYAAASELGATVPDTPNSEKLAETLEAYGVNLGGIVTEQDALIAQIVAALGSKVAGIVPEGTLEITENGTYDVAGYERVIVDIPIPDVPVVTRKYLSHLEMSSGQYIDTHFSPNQDTRVVIDYESIGSVSSQRAIFGARNTTGYQASLAYVFNVMSDTQIRSDYYGDSRTLNGTFSGRLHIDRNKNVCTVNEQTVTNNTRTGQTPGSMYIGAINEIVNNGINYPAPGKYYPCQVYDNGTMIRDYRPCIDENGVVCFWDEVNQNYEYNKGSGSFIAGEVIS